MIHAADLHAQDEYCQLGPTDAPVGRIYLRYVVHQISDVRNLQSTSSYLVSCEQRYLLPGIAAGFGLAAIDNYQEYPAVLTASAAPSTSLEIHNVDYFPRTINTAITTSASTSGEKETSSTTQHTSGSSTAQTNTYDISASVGTFGPDVTSSVTAGYSNSTTNSTDRSDTAGRGWGATAGVTQAFGMSIKDWASFGTVDADGVTPTWVWGQEYPWDVLAFHDDGALELPSFIQARLCHDGDVFPPSELSLFGLDLTAHARWLVSGAPDQPDDETLTVTHAGTCFSATHGLVDGRFASSMSVQGNYSVTGATLNLPLLGLDPVVDSGVDNGAVIPLSSGLLGPPGEQGRFRARSASNNLYITGSGFEVPPGPDSPLTTGFSLGAVALTIHFKIIDMLDNFALYLKHWKTSTGGCVATITINGRTENQILRHIDDRELSGGSDNVTVVLLRSADHRDGQYYDYLVPGLNVVDIAIAPSLDVPGADGYALHAVALG